MQTLMRFMERLERWMVAAAFAESGCWNTARRVMGEEKRYAQQHSRSRISASANQRPTLRM
jgi:hypothetical protein